MGTRIARKSQHLPKVGGEGIPKLQKKQFIEQIVFASELLSVVLVAFFVLIFRNAIKREINFRIRNSESIKPCSEIDQATKKEENKIHTID